MSDLIGSAHSRRRVVAAAAASIGLALTVPGGPVAATTIPLLVPRPQVSPDSFSPFINQGFRVWGGDVYTTLTLISVLRYPRGNRPAVFHDPFSLFFRGQANQLIPGGLYMVLAPNGYRDQVFLSPVTGGPVYEVPFN